MWIVNKYGWIGNGNIDQCICINIREGGNASNPNPIYPINYNWVDNLGCNSIDIWNLGCTTGCQFNRRYVDRITLGDRLKLCDVPDVNREAACGTVIPGFGSGWVEEIGGLYLCDAA